MLKSGKANEKQKQELFNAGMQLAEEQKEKTDEEAEILRILESAGVQVLSTEEWAKDRLAYIRGRRAEIAAADQKTQVLEDLDGEDEILAADELELSAYLDAIAKAESEPPADGAAPRQRKQQGNRRRYRRHGRPAGRRRDYNKGLV